MTARANSPEGERMVTANGVALCVQTFGDPADPAVLLIHGASASMLWWEAGLCERLAAGGRFVIRYDHRDTGRSVNYPAGRPGYAFRDMPDDALGVLDALGVDRAHLVGRSMGGGIAVLAAARRPERVRSLTLVTTSPGRPELSPASPELHAFTSRPGPDPDDPDAVVEHVVGLMRVYSGPSPYWDEEHARDIMRREVTRTLNFGATLANHFALDFGGAEADFGRLAVPTLVVHGERDPAFPLDHGQWLAEHIVGARLVVMEKAGHEVPPALWDFFAEAVLRHTSL
jgi:pimeloyl-ACP methyl ester carboxylesterase